MRDNIDRSTGISSFALSLLLGIICQEKLQEKNRQRKQWNEGVWLG
jgi:hypothetical protein